MASASAGDWIMKPELSTAHLDIEDRDLVYEKNYYLENGKAISRIWVEKSGVSISNKSYWDEIFDFFNDKMNALELFYEQYDEYIKDI